MDDVDAFLSAVFPELRREAEAIHSRGAGPRPVLWSHQDPVTLFDASSVDVLAGRDRATLVPPDAPAET